MSNLSNFLIYSALIMPFIIAFTIIGIIQLQNNGNTTMVLSVLAISYLLAFSL